jgi:hypothetical protein
LLLVAQEELALREEVRAAGARLQLLVQGAEIAGAPTARLRDKRPTPKPEPNPKLQPKPEPNLRSTLSLTLSLTLTLTRRAEREPAG